MIQLGGRFFFTNVLIESSFPMKLVRLIQKKCLNERYTCSRVCVDRNLSDMFPFMNGLKQRYAFSPLFFNFDLEYATRTVQVNQ